MEVRLLGPVEVHADTGQLPVRGPIQRALVAMLALHANRVVASEELLASVWGPQSTAARRSLQWQVWQLRRLLGTQAGRLVYRAPGYLLRVERGELDLARFQDLADQLRDTPSWRQRFGLVDEFLLRRAQDGPDPAPEVAWAWRRLVATGGRLPIGRLAGEVGWSHKHLISRFTQQGRPAAQDRRPPGPLRPGVAPPGRPATRTLGRDRRRLRVCRPGAPDPRLPPVHRRVSPAAFLAYPQAQTAVPMPA